MKNRSASRRLCALRKTVLVSHGDKLLDETKKILAEVYGNQSKKKTDLPIQENKPSGSKLKPKDDEASKQALKSSAKDGIRSIRSFLFTSYSECTSSCRSKPFYMSKVELLQTLRKHHPDLLKNVVGVAKLSKSELCKLLYSQ